MKTTSGNINEHLRSIEEKSSSLQHVIRSPLNSDKSKSQSSSRFYSIAKEVCKK